MSKKIIPKYVVIENSLDNGITTFSQCLGVFDNYYEAVGCAYSYISDYLDGIEHVYEEVTTLYRMENECDHGISFAYKCEEDNEPCRGYVVIHGNWEQAERMEEQNES